MRGKHLVWISLVAMLFMAMAGVGKSSGSLYCYVEPLWIGAAPGETFDIHIKAGGDFPNTWAIEDDVEDLFLAEIYMSFDPGLLEVVDDPATADLEGVNPSDQPNSLEQIHYEQLTYNTVLGWMELRLVAGRPLGVKEGLNGVVGVAKITFRVIGTTSRSVLKLYGTWLKNSLGEDMEVYARDGRFKNIYPTLWIKKKGAHGLGVWAESSKVPIGTSNTLYAKVVNTGVETANFTVLFSVRDPTGAKTVMESNEAEIAPGEDATVSAIYNVPSGPEYIGVYRFVGRVNYKIEPGVPPPYPEYVEWEGLEGIFGGEGTSMDVAGAKFRAE